MKSTKKLNRICECGTIAHFGSQCTGCGQIEINKESIKRLMLKISNRKRPKHLGINSERLFFNGESKTIREWEFETGLSQGCIYSRLKVLKWSIEKTLTTPSIQAIKLQRQNDERTMEQNKKLS